VFNRLRKRADKVRALSWHTLQEVDLWDQLPAGFCHDPMKAMPQLEGSIGHITLLPEGWRIGLNGRDASQAEVVLDAALRLVSVELLQ